MDILLVMGILQSIIDLRNNDEITRRKNPLNNSNFKYYNIDIAGRYAPLKEEDVSLGYIKILEDYDNVRDIFKIIASSKGGVLYNCTAGKDKTGIISMLLFLIGEFLLVM